jgi:hypothetical protein
MIDPEEDLHTIGLPRNTDPGIWIGLKRTGTEAAESVMKEALATEKGIMTGSGLKEMEGIKIGKSWKGIENETKLGIVTVKARRRRSGRVRRRRRGPVEAGAVLSDAVVLNVIVVNGRKNGGNGRKAGTD